MTDPGAILGVDDDLEKTSDQVLFAVPQIIAPKPIHAAVTVAQFVIARGIHDIDPHNSRTLPGVSSYRVATYKLIGHLLLRL
jgi:hypothetical protein